VYILFILPIYIYIYCLCLPWDERAELDQLPENRKKRKKRHLLLGMRGQLDQLPENRKKKTPAAWDERAELDQLPENRKKGKKRHLLLGMRGRSSTNCQKTGKKEKKDTCCLG
jgi:hypothetical protein